MKVNVGKLCSVYKVFLCCLILMSYKNLDQNIFCLWAYFFEGFRDFSIIKCQRMLDIFDFVQKKTVRFASMVKLSGKSVEFIFVSLLFNPILKELCWTQYQHNQIFWLVYVNQGFCVNYLSSCRDVRRSFVEYIFS